MKRYVTLLLCGAVVALVVSCTTSSNHMRVIPTQGLRLVPIDYTVIGDTAAEASRTSIFFIDFEHLFSDQYAQHISEESAPFFDSIEVMAKRAALYKALQKVPQADRLIEPRWTVKVNNFIIGKTVTVRVIAKAIAYTRSNPMAK